VGAGYFDDLTRTITAGTYSIMALAGSTEEQQFRPTVAAL
jgi:isocitrate lyase